MNLLLIIIIISFAVLIIFNPVLIAVSKGPPSHIETNSIIENNELVATLTLKSSKKALYVTKMHLPRRIAKVIGIMAPTGFFETQLVDMRSDREWVNKWNLENVMFKGNLELLPNQPTIIRFPLGKNVEDPFMISGQFEASRKWVNSFSFFQIKFCQKTL